MPVRGYYRVMMGKRSAHIDECLTGGFIGVDFGIDHDLSGKLPDEWRAFNREYIPKYLEAHPGKSRVAAGLACGFLWTVAKGIQRGDVVLSPDGEGRYRVCSVTGDYYYSPGGILPHRRRVEWLPQSIERTSLSEALRRSAGSIGTVSNVSDYAQEIEGLLGGTTLPAIVSTHSVIEDAATFAMEKHLEDFLVRNWHQTELSREFDIYAEDGEEVGQQYPTDTGPIDVLAVSKDRKRLLVLELKRGRASDAVVGQLLRYMGYVRSELAEDDQTVEGVIIALEDDPRVRRALSMVPSIAFYRYQVNFKLFRA